MDGIRVNEDSYSIQIQDATGTFHSLWKRDLKELKKLKGETPMPSFDGILTKTDLQDLVAYLTTLRREQ